MNCIVCALEDLHQCHIIALAIVQTNGHHEQMRGQAGGQHARDTNVQFCTEQRLAIVPFPRNMQIIDKIPRSLTGNDQTHEFGQVDNLYHARMRAHLATRLLQHGHRHEIIARQRI